MAHPDFTLQHRTIGRAAAVVVSFLGVVYAIVTLLGFLSLKSPDDPIGDPYFTLMELLIVLIVPLMVISMIAVHAFAPTDRKVYSAAALVFMILMAALTSAIHFTILTVSHPLAATGQSWVPLLLAFKWPSVVYTLDILAWDWFFALSVLFAAPVFSGSSLEQVLRVLLLVSGILSLAGLLGVPLSNMQVRNIGIVGYAVFTPYIFLLLAIVFGRTQPAPMPSAPTR